MALEPDDINLVEDPASGPPEPEASLRDTIRDAVDRQREPDGEQRTNDRRQGDGRDDKGRFASPEAKQAADDARKLAQDGPKTPHPSQAAHAQQQSLTSFQPPVGWSQQAKEAFGTLPAHVQEAIAQREEQINNGFRILQDYKGLEEFKPYIQQSGVSYRDVMDRAVKWERATLDDPIGTALHLLRIRGISQQLAIRAFQDPRVAQALRQQAGQRPQAAQQQQAPPLTLDQVRQAAREEYEQARIQRETDDDVSKFLADPANQHAPAIVDDMVMLINSGRADKLPDAYQMALRLHPELASVSAPRPNPRVLAANQARQASKAITGSPVGIPAPVRPKDSGSLRDTIRAAYNAQRGFDDE